MLELTSVRLLVFVGHGFSHGWILVGVNSAIIVARPGQSVRGLARHRVWAQARVLGGMWNGERGVGAHVGSGLWNISCVQNLCFGV